MKKALSFLLALILAGGLLAVPGYCEEEKLIEAREGERYALQIRSLTGDQSVGILGVESDPVPCRWGDFLDALSKDMNAFFTPAYWSDGRWVRLMDDYDLVIRVYTSDETDDGVVQSVIVNSPYQDDESVQVVTALAYRSAVQAGSYGSFAVQIALSEDHGEDWFTETPIQIWTENGYAFSYGLTENFGLPYGEIQFAEQMPVTGGYLPIEGAYVFLPDGMTLTALLAALEEQSKDGPLAAFLTPPVPDDVIAEEFGFVHYVVWDDCLLVILTDEADNLLVANILSLSGDTGSMCLHLYPLYAVIAGMEAQDMGLLSCFVGGNGTWEDMCGLEPYCVINGVLLQCTLAEMDDGVLLPMAELCGAEDR